MVETSLSFQNLSPDFQQVIHLAEDRYDIAVNPLQELGGGRSGALVYLVRVARVDQGEPEHLILKLDRKHPKATSDEITRHQTVEEESPPNFTEDHIPKLAFDRVEYGEALAIFYTIAGHSLRSFRTLSGFSRQSHLERLFGETNAILLDAWNPSPGFETIPHPRQLLEEWLGFRLNPGQKIDAFIREACHLPVDTSGFLVLGNLLPNPLLYARETQPWGSIRALDAAFGRLHRDLNTHNILARFSRKSDELEAYYLIDFALFKAFKPLFYDQRYLEMSYLIEGLASRPFDSVVELINRFSEVEVVTADEAPVEMAGTNAAIRAGREAFGKWIRDNHPSLHDDLWGQYWLAGAAAGLGYCHKAGMAHEMRLAGLIFAAANLKQFLRLFDLPMPGEAGQLYAQGQIGGPRDTSLPKTREAHHNLPAPRTPFIGREQEIREVTEILQQPDVRLITLTGPGGTGKTRLALEAARGVLDKFSHGVFFVDLAGINDPDLVIPTTAHTLGIREGSSQPPLEKLKDFLVSREMLLIFDNFEQVPGAAMSISELLQAAPDLNALVTSRVRLQLHGEREYPVSPLQIPGEEDRPLDDFQELESVALFRQSARAVQPGFEITTHNQQAVADICRRLDGLPLAIELAAARVKMLPPRALLERLDHRLEFLVSSAQDRPDRQKTLRETIDWSYQLLDPDEQQLFTRLGIFAGGFTLESAHAVCSSMGEIEVFNGIESLLNNSLVRQESSVTEEPRFDMLGAIREFAREKARQAGILEELQRDHCHYFMQLADGGLEGGIYGVNSVLWLKIYEQEHDNFRQAMSWALDHPQVIPEVMSVMLAQLSWFWYRHGYLQEGSEWMERTLQATEGMGDSPARAFALSGRGSLALWSGDLEIAAERSRQALEMGQRLGLGLVTALSKMGLGITYINQGRDKDAYPHLMDSIEMYDEMDNKWLKGTAMVHLANVSLGLGNIDESLKWLDMARPFMKESGDVWFKAFVLSNYGEVARAQGDYEKAEEYYRRTEAFYQEADSKGDQARLTTVLGFIAQHKGEYEEAQAHFLESLAEFQKLGNQRGMAEAMAGLAGLAAELGEYGWAARLLGAARSSLEDIGGVWWPADRVEIDRAKERLKSELGDDYADLWAEGETMSLDEAIAYAEEGWLGR